MTVKSPRDGAPTERRRGRPRSAAARRAILAAARELLDEGGLAAVTMEAVAARAGVGKPTIYRTWPDRHAVAMAALLAVAVPAPPAAPRRSLAQALRAQLRALAAVLASRTGRQVASMIAAADPTTELAKAFRNHFILARREEGQQLLERALRAGELRPGVDLDVALDLIYGPVFYRLLMGHGPLDERFTDTVVEQALRGIGAAGARPGGHSARGATVRRAARRSAGG